MTDDLTAQVGAALPPKARIIYDGVELDVVDMRDLAPRIAACMRAVACVAYQDGEDMQLPPFKHATLPIGNEEIADACAAGLQALRGET